MNNQEAPLLSDKWTTLVITDELIIQFVGKNINPLINKYFTNKYSSLVDDYVLLIMHSTRTHIPITMYINQSIKRQLKMIFSL